MIFFNERDKTGTDHCMTVMEVQIKSTNIRDQNMPHIV